MYKSPAECASFYGNKVTVWEELEGSVFLAQNKQWTERKEIRPIRACTTILWPQQHDKNVECCLQSVLCGQVDMVQTERETKATTHKELFSPWIPEVTHWIVFHPVYL